MTSTMRSPAISELPNAEMTVGEEAPPEERASRDSKKGLSAVREQLGAGGGHTGVLQTGLTHAELLAELIQLEGAGRGRGQHAADGGSRGGRGWSGLRGSGGLGEPERLVGRGGRTRGARSASLPGSLGLRAEGPGCPQEGTEEEGNEEDDRPPPAARSIDHAAGNSRRKTPTHTGTGREAGGRSSLSLACSLALYLGPRVEPVMGHGRALSARRSTSPSTTVVPSGDTGCPRTATSLRWASSSRRCRVLKVCWAVLGMSSV